MPKIRINDFSGGLVTNQSEYDLRDNQFRTFTHVKNKFPGKLERYKEEKTVSSEGLGVNTGSELVLYRTEKDGSNAEVTTEWWFYTSGVIFQRQDVSKQRAITGLDDLTPTPSGAWQGSQTHTNVFADASVTDGSGATFNVTTDSSGNPTFVLVDGGSGYLVDNQLSFKDPGSTTNTATLVVASVSSFENVGASASVWSTASTLSDILAHNQILRISDADFGNTTKWYGHIKRTFFGHDITYSDGFRFHKPPPVSTALIIGTATINDWYVKDHKLTPPTIKPMKYLFDQNNDIDTANDIGIFVHFPAGSGDDTALINNADNGTFKSKDRYTCTFVYDYIQESSLGRDSNNDIGVISLNAPSTDGNICPGIQLVMFTGTSLASLNQRITAINLYWKPEDDVDWYLIGTYDMNKGFSDDPRANFSAADAVGQEGTLKTNNGYWIPCAEPFPLSGSDISSNNYENVGGVTASTFVASDGVGWGSGFTATSESPKMVFLHNDNSSADQATVLNDLKETKTVVSSVKTHSGVNLTTGSVSPSVTINWKNWLGEETGQIGTDTTRRAYAADMSTDKVATWYLPNDGLKLTTYNSLTGRAAEIELKELKWKTSAILNNVAYYGNVDTVDDNSQTEKEKNRIYFTDPFKLDEIVPGRYINVKSNNLDEIVKLCAYNNRLFVFKKTSVHVYNNNRKMEKVFVGAGAVHKHAVFETPIGIVCANSSGIYAVTQNKVTDVSYNIKDTYQGLTLEQPMIGYDGVDNELFFVPDYNSLTLYVMNLDNGSWMQRSIESGDSRSNFILTSNLRAQYLETDT